jgi:hypothetical protein
LAIEIDGRRIFRGRIKNGSQTVSQFVFGKTQHLQHFVLFPLVIVIESLLQAIFAGKGVKKPARRCFLVEVERSS